MTRMMTVEEYVGRLKKREQTAAFTKNICKVPDSFQCANCKTYVANAEEIVEEEDRIRVRPLKIKFCPNCGKKVII
jgi:DNA-directed RNA polymerase subunit RPC12/RpoP